MKIGILTLPLHTNYGGILQAWALQTVVGRMGNQLEVFGIKEKRRGLPTMILVWGKRFIKKCLGKQEFPIFYEKKRYRETE